MFKSLGSSLLILLLPLSLYSWGGWTRSSPQDEGWNQSSGASTLNVDIAAYWKLDETSGTREDSVGSTDLTDNNTVGSAAGKSGNAAVFVDANNEKLTVTDNAVVSVGNVDWSLMFWVKPTDVSGTDPLVAQYDNLTASDRAYRVTRSGSNYSFDYYDTGGTAHTGNTIGSAAAGTWAHIAVVHDATENTIQIYLNKTAIDPISETLGIRDTSEVFQICGNPGTVECDATIDEVGIWDKALTQAEVNEHYNKTDSGSSYPF